MAGPKRTHPNYGHATANRLLLSRQDSPDGTHPPGPADTESPLLDPSVVVRFLAKIDFGGPDECWEWTASRHVRMGHGRLVVGGRAGKVEYAHRLAWQYWVGPIPASLIVRHTCDNPPCVNPAHLLVGTQADNALDMVKRRRHGKEKLTPDMVREIRRRPKTPGAIKAMAAEFGVHPQTITEIRHGRMRRDTL